MTTKSEKLNLNKENMKKSFEKSTNSKIQALWTSKVYFYLCFLPLYKSEMIKTHTFH